MSSDNNINLNQQLFDYVWENKNAYYEYLSNNGTGIYLKNDNDHYFLTLSTSPNNEYIKQKFTFYNSSHINPYKDLTENDVKEMYQEMNKHQLPLVITLPIADLKFKEKSELLFKYNFLQLTNNSPGMVCDLTDKNYNGWDMSAFENQDDLFIEELQKSDENYETNLYEWCNALVNSFGFPNKNEGKTKHFFHIFKNIDYGSTCQKRLFCIRSKSLQNKIITIGSLFIEPNKQLAGIYNIGTVKDVNIRKKGTARYLSNYLTYTICKKELNLKYCTLQSSPAAFHMYQQLNFKTVGYWGMFVNLENLHFIAKYVINVLKPWMKITGIRELSNKMNLVLLGGWFIGVHAATVYLFYETIKYFYL